MEYNLTKIFNFFLKYGLILSLTIGLYLFLNWRRRKREKSWQDIWEKPFASCMENVSAKFFALSQAIMAVNLLHCHSCFPRYPYIMPIRTPPTNAD